MVTGGVLNRVAPSITGRENPGFPTRIQYEYSLSARFARAVLFFRGPDEGTQKNTKSASDAEIVYVHFNASIPTLTGMGVLKDGDDPAALMKEFYTDGAAL
jgi:hypothetical protein